MGSHYEALGWTLVHVCWQAAVVAGLYKLTDLVRLRSQGRYMLGLAAMLGVLFMAAVTFLYEEARLSVRPDAGMLFALAPAPGFSLSHLLPWLDAAWIAGVAVMSARMAVNLWFIRSLNRSAEVVPEGLTLRFAAMIRRMGLTGKVRLRLHRNISGPFVIGAFRSVIYLPVSAVTALSPDQLDAVLAHELEHIRRADYLWNLVQSVIEALFFFHPAVWWLGSKLREQRELCCDDAALKVCADPLTYATALLSLEEQRRPRRAPDLVMALNGQDGGRGLMARIARMLGEKADMPRKNRPNAAFALPILLLILAVFMTPVAKVAAAVHSKAMLAAITGEKPQPTPEVMKVRVQTIKATMPQISDADASAMAGDDNWNGDTIDPDAIAAQARADAERARAEVARARAENIDVDAIVAEARRSAEQARQDMAREGLRPNIDVDAIAEQARAAAEQAKVQLADVKDLDIDVDAIAEQARAAAEHAKAQADWGRDFGQKFGRKFERKSSTQWNWIPGESDAPATPETPAPLMDGPTPPTSPSSPLAMSEAKPSLPAVALVAPAAAPRPAALPASKAPQIALAPVPPAPAAAPATPPVPSVCTKIKVKTRLKIQLVQQS